MKLTQTFKAFRAEGVLTGQNAWHFVEFQTNGTTKLLGKLTQASPIHQAHKPKERKVNELAPLPRPFYRTYWSWTLHRYSSIRSIENIIIFTGVFKLSKEGLLVQQFFVQVRGDTPHWRK